VIPDTSIIPIWQPQGYSTNHLARSVGSLYNTKATHTGTLDPMAEGIVVVLIGDTRLKRQELSSSAKGYEFEIAFGVSTDSFDGMGFIKETSPNISNMKLSISSLNEICSSFIGENTQTVPIFSAQLYKGKKLFEWGHMKEEIPLPKKSGHIYKFNVLEIKKISLTDFVGGILSKLRNIRGDFRQEEIIKQWEKYLSEAELNPFDITLGRFYVETSRGLYVRSLSQDLCARLNTIGFVSSLTRTKNGNYTRQNSVSLSDLFGENYDTILKLQN